MVWESCDTPEKTGATRWGIGYKWGCNRFVGKVLRQCPTVLVADVAIPRLRMSIMQGSGTLSHVPEQPSTTNTHEDWKEQTLVGRGMSRVTDTSNH